MISVVAASYQRGHYLDRSLHAYANQQLGVPSEFVLVDDGSTDDTFEVVSKWSKHIDITYIKLWKQEGLWRDCSSVINKGIRCARGEVVIGTHPEVMPGRKSLQALWDARQERTYLCAKVYYLTPGDQELLDTVPWRTEGALAVRQLPGFYDEPSAEHRRHADYAHNATDRHTNWESWVFGGFTRSTWRWFGGLTEYQTWGSVDVDFLARRRALGMPTFTALDPETIVVHQNHDVPGRPTDVQTPRDMEACMAALQPYPTPESARKNFI